MKIWYQSTAPIGFDSKMDIGKKLMIERAKKFASPNTEIIFYGCPIDTPGRDTYMYSQYLQANQVINNAVRAEREGYDAFVIGCGLDIGLYEIREIVDIPVVSMGESQYYFACLLGDKIAFMAHNRKVGYDIFQIIKKYGLEQRFMLGYYNSSLSELAAGFTNPQPEIKKWMDGALKVINQGAEVILPGCTRMSLILLQNGITRVKDAPIVDVIGVLIRTAETLVMLREISGVIHSRVCLYSSPGKQAIYNIRKANGLE